MVEERRIFPVEKALELVTGKEDADTLAIASFVLGRSIDGEESARAAAPFAAAWLARWYPKFMQMEWKKGDDWGDFVKKGRAVLGEHVSLAPMDGRLRDMANQTMDLIRDMDDSRARQTDAALKLEKRVKELEPLEARAAAAQKKCDELEATIKSMKTEMGALRRQVNEYRGKLAIDHDELMRNIGDAIKEGLKGATVAVGVASANKTDEGGSVAPAAETVEEEFGFGASNTDADGFGF